MSEQIRLGDLLTRAGLLRTEDLREGMLIAKQQSLPVGRVLIMAEFISEPNLQAAVQAQSMLKDGVIDIDTALAALQISAQQNVSLDDALQQHGWQDKSTSATNKLGGLLTEAGLISKEQLDQGLNQCQMSGLPLGRVLVAMGFMSEALLAAALNAQILIRDSKIQRDLAIQGLRACHERQISIEQSLRDAGVLQMPMQDTVRLGELFVLANLLNQDNLMQAVELGLTESKPIGQVLVEHKMVTEQLLEAALSVQRMVTEGKVKKDQCGDVLALMSSQGLNLEDAIKKLEPPKAPAQPALPLYQFLQLAGLITAKDIEEALKQGSRDTELMGKMLLLTGSIDGTSLGSAVRLNDMITRGTLKAEQAILAMGLCQNRNCSVEQAFKSLGWSMALDPAHSNQETIPPSRAMASSNMASGEHAAMAQSGQYASLPQQGQSGQYQAVDPAASGQYQQLGTGQHAALDPSQMSGAYQQQSQSGQFQSVDHSASGQYQQLGTGQHAALDPSQMSGAYQAQGTGQHAAIDPSQLSGTYQQPGSTGQHAAVPDHYESSSNQTATSDVPVISADSMLLQQEPEAFEAPQEEEAAQEEESGGSGKKKKGGGGGAGKKRLADLMP